MQGGTRRALRGEEPRILVVVYTVKLAGLVTNNLEGLCAGWG